MFKVNLVYRVISWTTRRNPVSKTNKQAKTNQTRKPPKIKEKDVTKT